MNSVSGFQLPSSCCWRASHCWVREMSFGSTSWTLNTSYPPGFVPSDAAPPSTFCQSCQGLDFDDQGSDNESLVRSIIEANVPGFYVFSAPWETIHSLLANINNLLDYNLNVPANYDRSSRFLGRRQLYRGGTMAGSRSPQRADRQN